MTDPRPGIIDEDHPDFELLVKDLMDFPELWEDGDEAAKESEQDGEA